MLWGNGGWCVITQFKHLTLAARCSTVGGRLALQKDTRDLKLCSAICCLYSARHTDFLESQLPHLPLGVMRMST